MHDRHTITAHLSIAVRLSFDKHPICRRFIAYCIMRFIYQQFAQNGSVVLLVSYLRFSSPHLVRG